MRKTSIEYIEYLKVKKKISLNTELAYRNDLDKFIEYMNLHRIFDYKLINQTNINSYVLHLELKGVSTATIMRNITAIKGYFDYLFRNHKISQSITEDIMKPHHQNTPRNAVGKNEWEKLICSLDSSDPKNIRNILMMKFMFEVGISVSELIEIKVSDVNLDLSLVQCKCRGKDKAYILSDVLVEELNSYMKELYTELESDTILFPNTKGESMSRQGVWKMVKTHAKKCGLEDINLSRLCKGDGN